MEKQDLNQVTRVHSQLHSIYNPLCCLRNASCSQTKKRKDDIPYLPEDIFFHILIWLPAEFLHYFARYVCKAWAKLIRDPSFIKAHLLQSKGGLFIQKASRPYQARFLELKDGDLKVSHLNFNFPGHMVTSGGGLSLFCSSHPHSFLYVGNPVTMRFESLPFPFAPDELFQSCHITFVPHTQEYKVVCHGTNMSGVHRWLVLTVGKNMSWRTLESPVIGNNREFAELTSASVGGVIYWSRGSNCIFAIELCDETAHSIQVPNEFVEKPFWLLGLGDSLSCIVDLQAEVQVCILKDLRRSEWAKLYKIRDGIDRQKFMCHTFLPVGWLDDGDILVYVIRKMGGWKEQLVVTNNVKTGEIKTFNDFGFQLIKKHTNSLASW